MNKDETWAMVRVERERLAGVLRDLGPEQWDQPSMCGEWRVRHVVGHLLGLVDQWQHMATTLIGGAIKHGFRLNRMWDVDARRRGAATPEQLLREFENGIDSRSTWRPLFPLMETLVHGQDIRRPLGLEHGIPPEVFGPAADLLRKQAYPYGVRKRIRGLRLEATHLDWATGNGPTTMKGPIEELLMKMAGRLPLIGAPVTSV